MSDISPSELAKKIGQGLLSFPVTHFTKDFAFDEAPYRKHISWLLEYDPARLFAAGEESGADGILPLPTYLVNSENSGLAAHAEAVCAATKLGVILYNRDNAII